MEAALTLRASPLGAFRLEVDHEFPLQGIGALPGPGGSGKTILLLIVAGPKIRASGRIALGEEPWQDRTRTGLVPAYCRGLGVHPVTWTVLTGLGG